MQKFKLLCDSFTHLTNGNKGYSTHAKESKYIEWVHDGHKAQQRTFDNLVEGDYTFYVDKFVPAAKQDTKSAKKFGMILECGWMNQSLIDDVKNNLDAYMNTYDAIFTWDESLVELHENIKWIPGSGSWIKEPQIYPKNKLVSIISSNNTFLPGHKARLEMVEQLKEYAPLFGRGFNVDGIILLEDDFDIEELNEEMYTSRKDAIKDNFERALKMEVVEDYIWDNYNEYFS